MSINQDIRYTNSQTDPNNPHGLYDFIKPPRSITGVGPPSPSLGENEWLYIDTSSGIEYKKEQGTWNPFFDMSSVPVVVPDPLNVNLLRADEIDTDTIRGKAGDSVSMDVGAAGNLDIIGSAGTNGIHLKTSSAGPSNIRLQANGFGEFDSGIRSYGVFVDNLAGKQINIDPDTMTISNSGGANALIIQNATQEVQTRTENLVFKNSNNTRNLGRIYPLASSSRFEMYGTGSDVVAINLGNQISKHGPSAFTIKHEEFNQDVNVITKGTGKLISSISGGKEINIDANLNEVNGTDPGAFKVTGGLLTVESRGGLMNLIGGATGFVQVSDTAGDQVIAIDAQNAKIANTSPGVDFTIENIAPSQNIVLKTNAGAVDADNSGLINLNSINGSGSITRSQVLGVDNAGVLAFRNPPKTTNMTLGAFGGNGTEYFNLAGNVAPGELWGTILSDQVCQLTGFHARLHYNNVWGFGGGAPQLQIGYITPNLPMTEANFILLYSHNVPNGAFYSTSVSGIGVNIPASAALCARFVLTGTSSTSTNAEVSISITTQ